MNQRDHLPLGFELARGAFAHLAFAGLVETLDLEQRSVRMFGNERQVPRLVAWYGEGSYSYSGQTHAPARAPAWLRALTSVVESATGARYNSVLANYYRDGRDSVAWHADDEPELGLEPVIASVSLGAPRRFAIKGRALGRWALDLEHGDLLVMRGRSQADYLHAIPKCAAAGARLNLTFRHVAA